MAKKQSSWVVVGISILLLIGLFVAGIRMMEKHTEIQTIETETKGQLEFVPTIKSDEAGTVSMKLKYIPVSRNINIFEHIYEKEEIAISDTNHTELYKLTWSASTKLINTHIYQVEKIVEGTFVCVLSMDIETLEILTTPDNGLFADPSGEYTAEVRAEGGNINLYLTHIVEEAEDIE